MIIVDSLSSRTQSKYSSILHFFIVSLLSSFLIALFGKARIFLPFTPIPIVLQMQLVFLLAFLLGPSRAGFAAFLFILQGGIGLPVLPSPLFFTLAKGYYIGYFFSAIAIGLLIRNQRSYLKAFGLSLIASTIVYLFGFLVFSFYAGPKAAFVLGVLPFIIPDLIKNLAVIGVLKRVNWAKR